MLFHDTRGKQNNEWKIACNYYWWMNASVEVLCFSVIGPCKPLLFLPLEDVTQLLLYKNSNNRLLKPNVFVWDLAIITNSYFLLCFSRNCCSCGWLPGLSSSGMCYEVKPLYSELLSVDSELMFSMFLELSPTQNLSRKCGFYSENSEEFIYLNGKRFRYKF